MAQQKSFARAVYDRDILGPRWPIIDHEGATIIDGDTVQQPYDQSTKDVLAVRKSEDGYPFAHVLDVRMIRPIDLVIPSIPEMITLYSDRSTLDPVQTWDQRSGRVPRFPQDAGAFILRNC